MQSLHPDFRTDLPGTEYFFIGSGKVTAAIQWSKDPDATPLGVILQPSEHFTRKWGSYLFHPEYGLARTMIAVTIDGEIFKPKHEDVCVSRIVHDGVPNILATWRAGEHEVLESFYCPVGSSVMIRWVCVRGADKKQVEIKTALYANPTLFSQFGSRPSALYAHGRNLLYVASKQPASIEERYMTVNPQPFLVNDVEAHLIYAIGNVQKIEIQTLWDAEREYWNKTSLQIPGREHDGVKELYSASAEGLRAVVSESGRFDSSVWQYGMEWGRDASRVAEALIYSGQFEPAKAVLTNILTKLSNEKGQVAEASRFRGGMNSELDSNGFVLEAVSLYVQWTSDVAFVTEHWERIKAIADHLLDPEFLDPSTNMLISARDMWERMQAMGIEPGYDVAHQCLAVVGLEAISQVAEMLGHNNDAKNYGDVSRKMKEGFLSHPTHSFIVDGRVAKRITVSGQLQKTLRLDKEKESSEYFSSFVPNKLPLGSAREHLLEPDVTQLFPILLGIIDPQSSEATNTLREVGVLWSQAWGGGGIGRYDISGEPDSPGPWALATILYAQAALLCKNEVEYDKAITWLIEKAGAAGSWFEFYGDRPTPPLPPVGILPWAWAEFIILFVKYILGARVDDGTLIYRPRLKGFSVNIRFRESIVHVGD